MTKITTLADLIAEDEAKADAYWKSPEGIAEQARIDARAAQRSADELARDIRNGVRDKDGNWIETEDEEPEEEDDDGDTDEELD